MKKEIKLVLGFLTLSAFSFLEAKGQQPPKGILQWKGNIDLISDYSTYSPAYQSIPASYQYLNSSQQLIIEGIPFQGYLFLSSYQGESLNRYSFSFDSEALRQTVEDRIEQRISSLQEIPSIKTIEQKLNNSADPENYRKLVEFNEQIRDSEMDMSVLGDYGSILKYQEQLSRYDPNEYAKYEQYLYLKSIEQNQGHRKDLKMIEAEGLINSGEALWYNFDAFQVGTTTPYFSDLNLAGVPVKGYYGAYSNRYLYLATANGTTLPFNLRDTMMSFSRNLQAYKFGSGNATNSHLHMSYVHGIDDELPTDNKRVANTIGGIDGRLKLFKGKLDLQVRTFLGVHTADMKAQSETNTITSDDISPIDGLGKWLSRDVELNSSTTFGNAHHFQMSINDKDLHIGAEYRRIDPNYRSVGLAYLQSDVKRMLFSAEKVVLNKQLRVKAQVRIDEDNLNSGKQSTSKNMNGVISVNSYFKKLPNVSLTYMPNTYTSESIYNGKVTSHKSHMLSLSSSKSYRLLNINQISSGSVTYNTSISPNTTFTSVNTSINQLVALNRKLSSSLQLVYRQTNASYYWSLMPLFRYTFTKRGAAHISFRYGEDYFQNTKYALNVGTQIKFNEKLIFHLSIIQNYYTLTNNISDLRVRASIRAIW